MNHLIHLCKKDFTFAKPWILGTWLAIVAGNVLPAVMPVNGPPLPWAAIRLWLPALLVFLTSTRIIHCDPLTGATGFMATRPVRPAVALGGKLAFIAGVLILPAALFALLHPVLAGFRLSGADHLLLLLENGLFYSLIAAAAVMSAVFTRRVGTMALLAVALLFMVGLLMRMANGGLRVFEPTIEDAHLRTAVWLVTQGFLTTAATAVAVIWAAKRRWPVTATVFLLSAGFLIVIIKCWKWNFVEDLAKDTGMEQIMATPPSLAWLEEPSLVAWSNRNSIPYAQVIRPYRIGGLKDGWTGKLVKFQSEARFADGTVWQSSGASSPHGTENFVPEILPQLGIKAPKGYTFPPSDPFGFLNLFECQKDRLLNLRERHATILGTGSFQLDRPFIAADLPARSGATAFDRRCQYRIDRVSLLDGQISVSLSTRGMVLRSKGDGAGGFSRMNLLMVNPVTKQFAISGGGSGSGWDGDDWATLKRDMSLAQRPGDTKRPNAEEFLKGARLYVIAVRYGGTITLPYEVPKMLLEEKR